MKNIKKYLKHIFTHHCHSVLAVALLIIFIATFHTFAAPPLGGYAPGATLDPDCAPGSSVDCVVTGSSLSSILSSHNATGGNNILMTSGDKILSASDSNHYIDLGDNSNDLILNADGGGVDIGLSGGLNIENGNITLGQQQSAGCPPGSGGGGVRHIGGLGGGGASGESIKFFDGSCYGFNIVGPTGLTGELTWNLPATQGGAGTFLQNDGSGNLSWVAGGEGGTLSSVLTAGNTTEGKNIGLTFGDKIESAADANQYIDLGNGNHNIVIDTDGNEVHIGPDTGVFGVDGGSIVLGTKNSIGGAIEFFDPSSLHNFTINGPSSLGANILWNLPNTQGGVGTFLKDNGSGNLSWEGGATGSSTVNVEGSSGACTLSFTDGLYTGTTCP
jgi:hypothetical protein